jgi:hypothetical protein
MGLIPGYSSLIPERKNAPSVNMKEREIRTVRFPSSSQVKPAGFSTFPTLRGLLRVRWADPSLALDEFSCYGDIITGLVIDVKHRTGVNGVISMVDVP